MKEYFKKYKLYIIIGVSILILLVGGTLAYYTWKSTSNAVVNAEVCTPEIYFSGGATVNGTDMIPVLSKENGLTKQIELKVDKTCTKGTTMNLYLDLETFPTELADSSFVYELYKNGTKVTSGNFANKQEGSTITLVSNTTVTTTKDTYILYIWIDGNQDNPGTMAGKNFLFKLWASGEGAIYKENVMGNYGGTSASATSTFLGSTKARNTIQSIVSESSNVVPSNAIESVDISSLKDSSVMLWYTDTDSNGLYEAHIGSSNGIVKSSSNVAYLFKNLTQVQSIDLSNFDTLNVTNMSHMFEGCSKLASLNLSGFNTSSTSNMSFMFYGCTSLTDLDLSSFSTPNVTNMSYMFRSCNNIVNLDLSNFDTSKVTNMNYMFYDCKALINLDLTSFDTSKVTTMDSMFSRCSSLINLDLSTFNTLNVEDMYYMFNACSSLKTIYVSNLWNTSKVTSSENMFNSCSSLKGAVSYNSTKVDVTMANYATGYLTYKANN